MWRETFYLLFLIGTTSSIWLNSIQNSIGATYLTSNGTGPLTNSGWIKLDGGFKKLNLFDDSSLALAQTGDSSNLGIHITQGVDVSFYEYYHGSPSLQIYFHGTPSQPLYDIYPLSSYSVYPSNFTAKNLSLETTTDPPVLNLNESTFTSLNQLTITWLWPTPYSRKTPTIQLRNNTGIVNCTIPTLNRTAISDCDEVQSISFYWPTATSEGCFYPSQNENSNSQNLQYSGLIRLTTEEYPIVNGKFFNRTIEYDFLVNFLFAQYATVSGSITLLAPIDIGVAIVGQVHKNTANPPTTYVYIVTEIGYPFKLRSFFLDDWVITPSGENNNLTTATLSPVDLTSLGYPDSDATESGLTSTQGWELIVVPGEGACQVDGLYNGTNVLQINCVDPSSTDCDPPESTGVNMSLSLASENFCGQIVANIGASLYLVPTDDTFTTGATALLIAPGAKAYFKMGLAATPTQGVSVQTITVDKVTVQTPGMSSPLAVLISNSPSLDFEVAASSTGLEVHFSFDMSDNTIFNVNPNSKTSLSVIAQAEIQYTGTPSSKKRSTFYAEAILPEQSTSSLVLASVGISALPNGSALLSPTIGLCFVWMLSFLLFKE